MGNKGMTVKALGQCEKDRKEWRALVHMQLNAFHAAISAWPCVLSDRPLCSGGYHLERGGMPLHDAVGINCKKGATTEHQDSAVKYMG